MNNLPDHAFLSPSKVHWINYDLDKLKRVYEGYKRTIEGTRIHEFAEHCINLGVYLQSDGQALSSFVNDALDLNMDSEVHLYYSQFVFGKVDAMAYKNKTLYIFDLKTGRGKPKYSQLDIYAALFCLSSKKHPEEITIICRVYQGDDVVEWSPEPGEIIRIMNVIIEASEFLEFLEAEEKTKWMD